MKILADENFRRDLVDWLRNAGHDVAWIVEDKPGSIDTELVERANQEDRMIMSADLDFGELVVLHGLPAPGILILRLGTLPSDEILRHFSAHWPQIEHIIAGQIVILTPHRIRSRPIKSK